MELVQLILQSIDCVLTVDRSLMFEENCIKVVLSQFNSTIFDLNHFCVISRTNLRSWFMFIELEFAIIKFVFSANSIGKAISFTN